METKGKTEQKPTNGIVKICAWKRIIADDDEKRQLDDPNQLPTFDTNARCSLCTGYNIFCPAYERIRTPHGVPMYPVHLTKQIVENIMPFYEKHEDNEVFLTLRLDAGGGYNPNKNEKSIH